ncbi:hypothetical protein C7B64_13705 [Merismopedia glauca CCAP 1448/3]|uniref:Uncharacterized protein n=2 Tax=Merismopedia TaxID=53402 RepID=A0A2T1C2B0_9CYAN|nr:hypothetical protein C7B64_13705 [Merismopedia glauca CCAP 1448/3]
MKIILSWSKVNPAFIATLTSHLIQLTLLSSLLLLANPVRSQVSENVTEPEFQEESGQFSTNIVCGFTPPAGYVAVAYRAEFSCPGSGINATVYQLPSNGLQICGFTPPAGYVAVSYRSTSACYTNSSSFGANNSTIIQTPINGLQICGLNSPSGFVPVAYRSESGCSTNTSPLGATNSTVIQTPTNGLLMCGLNPPPGYVISFSTYSSSCVTNNITTNPNAIVINATTPPPSDGGGQVKIPKPICPPEGCPKLSY